MNQADAQRILGLEARIDALEARLGLKTYEELRADIQTLKLRLGALQGQINSLRGRAPAEPEPEAA